MFRCRAYTGCSLNFVTFHSSSHEELPLAQLFAFPNLWEAHNLWDELSVAKLPDALDVAKLPHAVTPYIMVMDIDAQAQLLRIRHAGSRLCDEYRADLCGLTADDIFESHDAMAVTAAGLQMAMSGEPSLARKSSISIAECRWSYTQLVLPLSSDGAKIDRLIQLIDPSTLVYMENMRATA